MLQHLPELNGSSLKFAQFQGEFKLNNMPKQDPYTTIFNEFASHLLTTGDSAGMKQEKLKLLHLAWNQDVATHFRLKVNEEIEQQIAEASAADDSFAARLGSLREIKQTRFNQYKHYILSIESNPEGTGLIVESVDPASLSKLGSVSKPAMMNVHTEDQALDVLAYCSSRGWQVIVEVRPEDPEDLYPLYYLQNGLVPEETN